MRKLEMIEAINKKANETLLQGWESYSYKEIKHFYNEVVKNNRKLVKIGYELTVQYK